MHNTRWYWHAKIFLPIDQFRKSQSRLFKVYNGKNTPSSVVYGLRNSRLDCIASKQWYKTQHRMVLKDNEEQSGLYCSDTSHRDENGMGWYSGAYNTTKQKCQFDRGKNDNHTQDQSLCKQSQKCRQKVDRKHFYQLGQRSTLYLKVKQKKWLHFVESGDEKEHRYGAIDDKLWGIGSQRNILHMELSEKFVKDKKMHGEGFCDGLRCVYVVGSYQSINESSFILILSTSGADGPVFIKPLRDYVRGFALHCGSGIDDDASIHIMRGSIPFWKRNMMPLVKMTKISFLKSRGRCKRWFCVYNYNF